MSDLQKHPTLSNALARAGLAVALTMLCVTQINDLDWGFYLAIGREVMRAGIPGQEFYLPLLGGQPFASLHVLSSLLFALAWELAGPAGIVGLKLAGYGGGFLLAAGAGARRWNWPGAAVVAAALAAAVSPRFVERPGLFSILLLGLLLRVAASARIEAWLRARPLRGGVALAVLFTVWSWLHAEWYLGLGFAAAWILSRGMRARTAFAVLAPAALVPLASFALLHPAGLAPVLSPLAFVVGGGGADFAVREYALESWKGKPLAPLAALAALAAGVWLLRERRWWEGGYLLGLVGLTVLVPRAVLPAALVAVPYLCEWGASIVAWASRPCRFSGGEERSEEGEPVGVGSGVGVSRAVVACHEDGAENVGGGAKPARAGRPCHSDAESLGAEEGVPDGLSEVGVPRAGRPCHGVCRMVSSIVAWASRPCRFSGGEERSEEGEPVDVGSGIGVSRAGRPCHGVVAGLVCILMAGLGIVVTPFRTWGLGIEPTLDVRGVGAVLEKIEQREGPIFCTFGSGSLLLSQPGAVRQGIVMDGRQEAYSSTYFEDVYEPLLSVPEGAAWLALLDVHGIAFYYEMFPREGPVPPRSRTLRGAGWKLVAWDNAGRLFTRAEIAARHNLPAYEFDPALPGEFLADPAAFAAAAAELGARADELRAAGLPAQRALVLAAAAAVRVGDAERAAVQLEAARREGAARFLSYWVARAELALLLGEEASLDELLDEIEERGGAADARRLREMRRAVPSSMP